MDLNQLRYFSKIVEHQSFTRAARDCLVSQPALSQQISKLEKELGQPLFERHGRKTQLTSVGQILYSRVQKILDQFEDLQRQLSDDGRNGRIRISAIPTIAPYLLPRIIQKVASQFPLAQFDISENTTDHLLDRLTNGDVDIGMLAHPFPNKSLTCEHLLSEELLLALPADHPLAEKSRVTPRDLAREPFILLSNTHCLQVAIEAWCHSKNFQPITYSKVEQLATLKSLVAIGKGISFVPQMAARKSSETNDSIVYRSLNGEKPIRKIGLCFNPYRFQSQLLTNFLKGIREWAGSDILCMSDSEQSSESRQAGEIGNSFPEENPAATISPR